MRFERKILCTEIIKQVSIMSNEIEAVHDNLHIAADEIGSGYME
ncbi:MAG: hypothetical protein WDA65_08830 [Christensenellales bacterium]